MLTTSKTTNFTGTSQAADKLIVASFNASVGTDGKINAGMTMTGGNVSAESQAMAQADFAEFLKQAYALQGGDENESTETTTEQ